MKVKKVKNYTQWPTNILSEENVSYFNKKKPTKQINKTICQINGYKKVVVPCDGPKKKKVPIEGGVCGAKKYSAKRCFRLFGTLEKKRDNNTICKEKCKANINAKIAELRKMIKNNQIV